ncbi:nucleotide exchange factor GrpE [Longimycelium tulufanense]|uniref:Nucleotide exchange factor GrpE n=1 Tax=Longimycelium tulufanense TaxID=907463 RepID=A0A8J3CD45_9PSEU|nr:nucleotide exchange factor GrpE [Longimycelium tulufanense]GGM76348.1 nucleotide exchange factor GrpE [Longimycelium tulufanense]
MSWFRRRDRDNGVSGRSLGEGNASASPNVDDGVRGSEGAAGNPLAAADLPVNRLEQVTQERDELVRLCLYALDRARSAGVAERIEQGLARVGVMPIRPDGERFDPGRHEAGGTVPTDDPALNGVIAETELVGFADQGRLLRAPIVTVYTARGTS